MIFFDNGEATDSSEVVILYPLQAANQQTLFIFFDSNYRTSYYTEFA